jgi:hypothetical protein
MSIKTLSATFIFLFLLSSSATARDLNPSSFAQPNESLEDQYFRIAFSAASSADFDTAIINYRRAASVTRNECDRKHALYGMEAALRQKQAKNRGESHRLTQGFWVLLQRTTKGLSCVTVRRGETKIKELRI